MILGNRYRLISLAGRGGTAEVWRAESLGAAGFVRTVAVKRVLTHLLHTERLRTMFVEEARVCSLLDHPNVVQVFDFGQDGEDMYLVMEWVEGLSLREFLDVAAASQQRPSAALAAAIGIEVLHALEAAHLHATHLPDGTTRPFPIVHRDVSPQNVLLSVRGVVKLADFGFARAFDRSRMTPADMVMGKLAYLPPEQARGEPASERSDLYSCGVMLWEMLCGRRLFAGESDLSIAIALRARRPHPRVNDVAPEVPAALAEAIDRAVLIDPAERHPSATEFARALCDALRQVPERTDASRIAAEVAWAQSRRRHARAPSVPPPPDAPPSAPRAPTSVRPAAAPGEWSVAPIPLLPSRRPRR